MNLPVFLKKDLCQSECVKGAYDTFEVIKYTKSRALEHSSTGAK